VLVVIQEITASTPLDRGYCWRLIARFLIARLDCSLLTKHS